MAPAGHLRTKDSGTVRFILYSDHFGSTFNQVLDTLGSLIFALMALEA